MLLVVGLEVNTTFFWLQSVSCSKDVRFALKANEVWSVPFM